jgi:predicted nucleic acid-binding protein
VDSSFLIAYFNESDAHHAAAASAWGRLLAGEWGPALLPEDIFLEVVTVLAARRGIEKAAVWGTQLLESAEFEFVDCSPFFRPAFERFRMQRGTKMSLADTAILAIAGARRAGFVATFDDDFRGFAGISVVPA